MREDSVSVVVPTYNRALYVRQAVDSVLAQEGFAGRLQVIVVDDGSTDDTPNALEPVHDRVRYVRIRHTGAPAVARNVGLEAATGRYVAFLNSDDVWLPLKLGLQLPLLEREAGVAFVYGNCEYIDTDGEPSGTLVGVTTR